MITRTFSSRIVNAYMNAPEIRPTIGGEGELDASALLSDQRNICLIHEDGGAMFAWRGPRVFEGHSFFHCRGGEAIALGRALLTCMFAAHEARIIWGLTPVTLRHVRWFNRKLGFRSEGVMATPDGPCELFVMELLCP